MMLRYALNQPTAADRIASSFASLDQGDRTGDIMLGMNPLGCRAMGDALIHTLRLT